MNVLCLLLTVCPLFYVVTICEAQSTMTDDMDETITYFDFNSDSDSGPIFFMQDDMSTRDESDTDGDLNNVNMPNNQNQNVSKFSFQGSIYLMPNKFEMYNT